MSDPAALRPGPASYGGVVLGSMAVFALSRYAFRGRDGLFLMFTAGLLFPLNTAALPLFLMLQKIGMNDNLLGVALPEAAFALPVTIVILRPFMRAIPGETAWRRVAGVERVLG